MLINNTQPSITAQQLADKYNMLGCNYEQALAEIDHHFNEGNITQREWAKLYQIIVDYK